MNTSLFNKLIFRFSTLLFLFGFLAQAYAQAPKWENPEWENPEIFEIDREEPTASFYRYADEKTALENDSWENSLFTNR